MEAVAAILVEQQSWLSKGTFLLPRPTHTRKFRSVAARVHEILDGNKNQYGGCGGHLGGAVVLVIERNLPLTEANMRKKIGSIAARVHEILDRNEKPRWLLCYHIGFWLKPKINKELRVPQAIIPPKFEIHRTNRFPTY